MHRTTDSRRATPKVLNGKVQKKDRHAPTRLNSLSVGMTALKGLHAGRQVVSKEDVWKFIRLIPDWKRVSSDLDLIYLSSRDNYADGWYEYPQRPMIVLNCWDEADLTMRPLAEYFRLHQDLFERLGVEVRMDENGWPVCQFDEDSARAFQLLHIFLHELGHHHYRITKGRGQDAGDEKYAEAYALKMEKKIWRRYCEVFKFRPKKLSVASR